MRVYYLQRAHYPGLAVDRLSDCYLYRYTLGSNGILGTPLVLI
jgi:hypothetical protein